MSDKAIEEIKEDDWKPKALVIGGVVGAAIGTLATYLLIQSYDEGEQLHISAGQGVKLGVLVFGLLRNVAGLADD